MGPLVGLHTDPEDVRFASVRLGWGDRAGEIITVPVDQPGLTRGSTPMRMSELAFVLRGRDELLLDLLRVAKRWWAGLSGQIVRAGRPRGSGTFPVR